MTATYEQFGIRFLYPENWELDNRDDTGQPWSVSVHSPTGAFWSITVHDQDTELTELLDQTLQTIEQEYEQSFFESFQAKEEIAGHMTPGYDINFFYLDFLICAKLRVFQLGQHDCVVLYQGENRDFDELQRVFDAITFSLFTE